MGYILQNNAFGDIIGNNAENYNQNYLDNHFQCSGECGIDSLTHKQIMNKIKHWHLVFIKFPCDIFSVLN